MKLIKQSIAQTPQHIDTKSVLITEGHLMLNSLT